MVLTAPLLALAYGRPKVLAQITGFLMHFGLGEAFGLVLAEAMACGVPVAGSRSGALPEVVDDSKWLGGFDAGFEDRARALVFGFTTQLSTNIKINRTTIPENELNSAEDLLDPKWKGKIAFTDPANSGSAYATVTMLVDLWGGGDAGWKKVGELFRNLKVLNRSSLVFQGVGNGEYPLGISLEYAGPMWAAGGAPVKVVYPADGTTASMEGVAIVKGGPNNESAKAFVDYINRRDVREMILKATFRRPTRSDVDLAKLPGDMPPMSAVKIIKYDEDGWTDKRTKTLERIKDLIQDSR